MLVARFLQGVGGGLQAEFASYDADQLVVLEQLQFQFQIEGHCLGLLEYMLEIK